MSWPLNRQVLLMATEWHWGLLGTQRFWQSKSPFLRPKIPASLVLTSFIQPRSRRRCRHEGEVKVSGIGCVFVTGRAQLRGLQTLTPSFPPDPACLENVGFPTPAWNSKMFSIPEFPIFPATLVQNTRTTEILVDRIRT